MINMDKLALYKYRILRFKFSLFIICYRPWALFKSCGGKFLNHDTEIIKEIIVMPLLTLSIRRSNEK